MLNESEDGKPIDASCKGLARELARMNLSLNFYTQWYWKTDLHNLLNFLSLRADDHAQYEIRAYAEAMIGTLEKWVPLTAEAFRQHRMGGAHLSAAALEVVKQLIAGKKLSQEESGLSKREWVEVMEKLGKSN
jgi:thymidylate synthase (FAD)